MKIRDSGMPDETYWSTFFDPDRILQILGLPSAGTIVDLGCGYGTFTIPAARLTDGKVIGFDIEAGMLSTCQRKVDQLGLGNVQLIQRDFLATGTGLKPASVNFVMLFNIMHTAFPVKLLAEAFRILCPSGKVAILHWNYDPTTPRGPDMTIRPKPEQCVHWLQQAGFSTPRPIIDLPPFHYGIVGVKDEYDLHR